METYLYKGFRVPLGWKIKEDSSQYSAIAFHDKKTIVLVDDHIGDIAHETMHARISEKYGTTGKNWYTHWKPKFPSLQAYVCYHELLAMTYEFHTLIKQKNVELLKKNISTIKDIIDGLRGNQFHHNAALQLVKSNIWKRALALAGRSDCKTKPKKVKAQK